MKLLLDQGTPCSAAALLRDAGHDAVHTAEIGLAEGEDAEILATALQENRIVVTLDADFHAHLVLSQAKAPCRTSPCGGVRSKRRVCDWRRMDPVGRQARAVHPYST